MCPALASLLSNMVITVAGEYIYSQKALASLLVCVIMKLLKYYVFWRVSRKLKMTNCWLF